MRPPTPEAVKVQVRRDRAAGMTHKAIAEKHHLSLSNVQRIAAGGNGQRSDQRPPKNGAITIVATPELVDGIWRGLPLERKAALINRLSEV